MLATSSNSQIYKKKIKASFVGCEFIKHKFQTHHCIVGISVGQRYFEGARLEALLRLINRHFQSCTILVGDVLQRHNLYFENNNYDLALRNGDRWLFENLNRIEQLTIPYKIERWEKWLHATTFPHCFARVKNDYAQKKAFYAAVNATIDDYYQRIIQRSELKDLEQNIFYETSKNYILEEVAVINLMLPQQQVKYFIYPNVITPAFAVSHEIFTQPTYPEMMQWVHVHLKKK